MAESSSRKKDYSQHVRKRLAGSSRTGQACDRCKLRKIRCDVDPNGCAGCRAAVEPCATTDRISKKAFRRGHTDQLEVENANLKVKLHDMQQKLLALGISLSPDTIGNEPTSGDDAHPSLDARQFNSDRRHSLASSADGSVWQKHMSNISGSTYSNPAFSMLRGTKLSLFGMQIDLAEFAEGHEDVESPQTLSGFVHIANLSNTQGHVQPPPLPPTLKQAREYAHWFFMFLNSYTPLLNKREVDKLLTDVYADPRPGPRPGRSAAEEVMLHVMFSYIKHQYGQRNQIQQLVDEAIAHLKYSITLVQEILKARTFQDIQAMSLIVLQLRGLKTPGACWIFGQLTMNLAVECGLHRSAESLSPTERQQLDPTGIEARKRVFWALYGLVSNNSTRLGRPPPLRLADIDIEFPLPVHDFLDHEEQTLTEFQKCSFHVGITIAKLMALFSDLHYTFYTITKPPASSHGRLVAKFRNDLDLWHADVPLEISESIRAQNELTMYAMYLDLFRAEFRFLLYHPLLHPPNQTESYKKNITACEEAIRDALNLLLKIKELKSLDVPWHTTTLLLAMTFTQLFIGDQRGTELTQVGFQQLESDMSTWLELFGAVGEMLGSGERLQIAVKEIIKNVLDKLRADINSRAMPSSADMLSGTYQIPKNYGMRIVPIVKSEKQDAYDAPAMQDLRSTVQPFAGAGAQATFEPFVETQGVYPTFAGTSYGESSQHTKQIPSTSLGSSIGYPGYYQVHDSGLAPRTTTPATDWMRWTQANLNPFAQHTPSDFMNPTAATTLMSMSDTRSTSRASADQAEEHHQQWPFNFYNGAQYAVTRPG